MKTRSEEGYALLIVLLLVVFIMIISATFITGSVNHAKQEKIVDTNNMAVVAAEMGVDYYKSSIAIESKRAFDEIMNEAVNKRITDLILCVKNKGKSCITKEDITKEVNAINLFANIELRKKVDLYLKSATFKKGIENSKQIGGDSSSGKVFHYLAASLEPNFTIVADEIVIPLTIVGKSAESKKELKSQFTLGKQNFVIEKSIGSPSNDDIGLDYYDILFNPPKLTTNCLNIDSLSKPIKCNLTHKSLEAFVKDLKSKNINPKDVTVAVENLSEALCVGKSGNCNSDLENLTVYSKSDTLDKIAKNANGIKNITLVNKGEVVASNNMNNSNFRLITESLINGNNLQNVYGSILIMGNSGKTGIFKVGKYSVNHGGKICLNLDGINLKASSGSGKKNDLLYYSSTGEEWSVGTKFIGSFAAFINECSEINLNPTSSNTTEFIQGDLDSNFKIEVNY